MGQTPWNKCSVPQFTWLGSVLYLSSEILATKSLKQILERKWTWQPLPRCVVYFLRATEFSTNFYWVVSNWRFCVQDPSCRRGSPYYLISEEFKWKSSTLPIIMSSRRQGSDYNRVSAVNLVCTAQSHHCHAIKTVANNTIPAKQNRRIFRYV